MRMTKHSIFSDQPFGTTAAIYSTPIMCIVLKKEMAIHCSTLGKIPWREDPGGLQSPGSQRVRHD